MHENDKYRRKGGGVVWFVSIDDPDGGNMIRVTKMTSSLTESPKFYTSLPVTQYKNASRADSLNT